MPSTTISFRDLAKKCIESLVEYKTEVLMTRYFIKPCLLVKYKTRTKTLTYYFCLGITGTKLSDHLF
jgi:hypothetical protein